MTVFPSLPVGAYRHNKTGKLYEVLGVALHTETDEPLVVYKPLWKCEYPLFTRPYAMFVEDVMCDGVRKPRFEKVEDAILRTGITKDTHYA